MTYCEACPECGSEDWEVDDYGDSFDEAGGEQWWTATCSGCGCVFNMTKVYQLTNIIIEKCEDE